MGDEFDQFKSKPAGGDEFDQYKSAPKEKQERTQGPGEQFARGVFETAKGAAKGAGRTLLHMSEFASSAMGGAGAAEKQFQSKAETALKPTNDAQKWGMTAEQFGEFFIPIGTGKLKAAEKAPRWIKALVGAGREALDIGMKTYAQTKDPWAALKAAGVGGAVGAAGEAAAGAKVFGGVKSRLSPKETAAIGEVKARGVPASAGDVTGNKVLKAGEQKLGYVPGAIGPMARHAAEKTAKGTEALEKLPAEVGGKVVTPEGAGQGIEKSLRARYTDWKKQADTAYDKVRELAAKSRRQVQVGTKQGSVLDPRTGKPVETPVVRSVEFPVPLGQVRSALAPYYEEMLGRLPETVRANSPGYAILEKIVKGQESMQDALALDKDLSTVKEFLRRYGSGAKDSAGRYASAVVDHLGQAVTDTIGKESPEALEALKAGRALVKRYAYVNELVRKLKPEGQSASVIYDRLTTASGKLLPDLKELNKLAPEEVRTMARTYVQGMVEDITRSGRLERLGMARKQLSKLQPEVREIMFGKAKATQIDNFLQGLQQIGADTNPSGTAKWAAITEALGAGGEIGRLLFSGDIGGAAAGAGALAAQGVIANRLAKLLTSEKGVRMLTNTIKLPQSSKGFSRALEALGAEAAKADQDKDQAPSAP